MCIKVQVLLYLVAIFASSFCFPVHCVCVYYETFSVLSAFPVMHISVTACHRWIPPQAVFMELSVSLQVSLPVVTQLRMFFCSEWVFFCKFLCILCILVLIVFLTLLNLPYLLLLWVFGWNSYTNLEFGLKNKSNANVKVRHKGVGLGKIKQRRYGL